MNDVQSRVGPAGSKEEYNDIHWERVEQGRYELGKHSGNSNPCRHLNTSSNKKCLSSHLFPVVSVVPPLRNSSGGYSPLHNSRRHQDQPSKPMIRATTTVASLKWLRRPWRLRFVIAIPVQTRIPHKNNIKFSVLRTEVEQNSSLSC